jgi:hypothetical protein
MYIYSGTVRLGICGTKTPFTDVYGKHLFVGDIVVTHTDGWCAGMTAVVDNSFISYSDGTHVINTKDALTQFVMGIRGLEDDPTGTWKVNKIKDWSDVIEGEKWSNFGFSYSAK